MLVVSSFQATYRPGHVGPKPSHQTTSRYLDFADAGCFYIALLPALEQAQCTFLACISK